MTEIMPVPRNLNFTVLPAESLTAPVFLLPYDIGEKALIISSAKNNFTYIIYLQRL